MRIVSICSGGLDSVAYTARYVKEGHEVHILMFDYGQKCQQELLAVQEIFEGKVVEIRKVDITFIKELFGKTQLTDDSIKVEGEYTDSIVVPNRNTLFILVAVIYAQSINADRVILGSHADDVAIINNDFAFPDCDSRFFELLENTLRAGHFKKAKRVEIFSPSREGIGKVELIKMGYKYLGAELFKTYSCYLNEEKQCGKCNSCVNRKKAFELSGIKDLTKYKKQNGKYIT